MDQILNGLYLGSYADATDYGQLYKNQISNIVSVMSVSRPIFPDIEYLCIKVKDSIEQNLMQFFPICNRFIHEARMSDENVLVHCAVGRSRSVTVVAAYLMAVANINFQEALLYIRTRRSIAEPNPSFKMQLNMYEWGAVHNERNNLNHKFQSEDSNRIHTILANFAREKPTLGNRNLQVSESCLKVYIKEHSSNYDKVFPLKAMKDMGFVKVQRDCYHYTPPHKRKDIFLANQDLTYTDSLGHCKFKDYIPCEDITSDFEDSNEEETESDDLDLQ